VCVCVGGSVSHLYCLLKVVSRIRTRLYNNRGRGRGGGEQGAGRLKQCVSDNQHRDMLRVQRLCTLCTIKDESSQQLTPLRSQLGLVGADC